MYCTIDRLPGFTKVLHLDQMCNAGPSWVRQIASMSNVYTFICTDINTTKRERKIKESKNFKEIKRKEIVTALLMKPTHIVCGGGFWYSYVYKNFKDMIKEYIDKNPNCISFGYWGDSNVSLIQDSVVKTIFCSSVDGVEEFKKLGAKVKYAVHPIDKEIFYRDDKCNEFFDWCFVGTNYGKTRSQHLDKIKNITSKYIIRGPGHNPKVPNTTFEQTADIFRKSKIVLHINDIKCNNLSMHFSDRLLMGMFCGKFMLTNYGPDMEKVFKRGIHLDWYKTEEELVNKIKYYLNNANIRNKIAMNGYKLVSEQYSIQTMLPSFFNFAKNG